MSVYYERHFSHCHWLKSLEPEEQCYASAEFVTVEVTEAHCADHVELSEADPSGHTQAFIVRKEDFDELIKKAVKVFPGE